MSSEDFDPELFNDFVEETLESLESLDPLFVELEENFDLTLIDKIFRTMHTTKGNSAFLNLHHIKDFTHRLENLLDDLRKDKVKISPEIIDLLLNGKDLLFALIRRQKAHPELSELNELEKNLIAQVSQAQGQSNDGLSGTLEEKLSRLIDVWGKKPQRQIPEITQLLNELEKLIQPETKPQESPTKSDSQTETSSKSENLSSPTDQKIEKKEQKGEKEESKKETDSKTFIRVDQDVIDGFLKDVGELVTIGEVFKFMSQRMNQAEIDHQSNFDLSKEFQNTVMGFNQLSHRLQRSVLEIRKVPIKPLLAKIPRMVRTLSKDLGKKVRLNIQGDETTLDKALLGVLEDPMVHFIRNSLDHGVETPEERKKNNKDETGHVFINASADENHFYLIIEDDGKGIEPKKMREVAVSKGVLTASEAKKLTDQEAQEIIFMPGFSTAETLTDVSGRGVGMDVVLTNIRSAKGKVQLESTPGKGSRFTIQLPLTGTTVVVPSLHFMVCENSFAIPLEFIQSVEIPLKENLSTVQNRGKVYDYRNTLVPVTCLENFYSLKRQTQKVENNLVIIEDNGHLSGLMVDKILGIQQIVLKELSISFTSQPAITGAALMGDGSIAMMLNCKELTELLKS